MKQRMEESKGIKRYRKKQVINVNSFKKQKEERNLIEIESVNVDVNVCEVCKCVREGVICNDSGWCSWRNDLDLSGW
jgi:hypothetical protein